MSLFPKKKWSIPLRSVTNFTQILHTADFRILLQIISNSFGNISVMIFTLDALISLIMNLCSSS